MRWILAVLHSLLAKVAERMPEPAFPTAPWYKIVPLGELSTDSGLLSAELLLPPPLLNIAMRSAMPGMVVVHSARKTARAL